MKNYIRNFALAVFVAALSSAAYAQTVVKQPVFIQNQQWNDIGNGPLDVQPVEGSGNLYTSSGTGTGSTSGSSTSLTLTAAPAIQPCVGCIISGTGITSGTTVTAFNGITNVTLSAAMTVASGTALAWGAACPAATAANVIGTNPNAITPLQLGSPIQARAGASASGNTTFPMYTQGRLCAYGALQSGFTFLYFAIGAH